MYTVKLDRVAKLNIKKRILLNIKFHQLFHLSEFTHSVYYTRSHNLGKYVVPFPASLDVYDRDPNLSPWDYHPARRDIENQLKNTSYLLEATDLITSSFGYDINYCQVDRTEFPLRSPVNFYTERYHIPGSKKRSIDLSNREDLYIFDITARNLILTPNVWRLELVFIRHTVEPPINSLQYIIIKYFIETNRLLIKTTIDDFSAHKVYNFLKFILYNITLY